MSYIRTAKRENPFVQIDKYFLDDENLSFEAKGIMAYVLSKPNTWIIRKTDMMKRSKSGKTRIESAMLELMANGYLNWYRLREEDGTFGEWVYDVYERPEFNPEAEKFIAEGKIRIEQRKSKNRARAAARKNIEESIELDLPTDLADSDSSVQPKVDNQLLDPPKVDYPPLDNPPVDNPPLDNQPFSNIESSNIEFSNTDFKNNDFKKNDEEEDIYKLRSENIIFDFIFDFFEEKGLTRETAIQIVKNCKMLGLDSFTAADVEKQFKHMLYKQKMGERIYDYSTYFANGLKGMTEQTIVAHRNDQDSISRRDGVKVVPFYDWIEERG